MAWEIETVRTLSDENLFAEMVAIDLGLFMWEKVESGEAGYDQYQDNINSYTVPVGASDFSEVQFDGSVNPMPDWGETKARFFRYTTETHKAEFNSVDLGMVLERLLPGQLTGVFNRGDWVSTEIQPEELKPTWLSVKTEWDSIQAEKTLKETLAAAYKIMTDNIASEMYNVFKTKLETSANAFAQSWKIKSERPELYISEGLIATEAIAGFSVGEALDTAQKVQDYYTEKVDQLIAFDKFRDTQINAYLAAKVAAEA